MFFGGGGFPFAGMHGMHGMDEDDMPGAGRGKKDVNTTEFYEILGVDKSASQDEIRKAYKKLAVKHHPDKGGDEAVFKKISEAADVLLDETKREIYDKHGKDGLEGGMHEGADDLFSALFNRGERRPQKKQIAPIQKKVEVELEDFYCGRSFELDVQRKRFCDACKGTGANSPDANTTCNDCGGHGVQLLRRQIAPGFTQQMQVQCSKCDGTGTFIPKKNQCKQCGGEKLRTETKKLTVDIMKGMQHQEKIVFREEGHQLPDIDPGDVVVHLLMAKHKKFVRKGNDLLQDFDISLADALNSNKVVQFEHLDDRIVNVTREAGTIIRPGMVCRLVGEGMPKRENPTMKGDMYLKFNVVFPTSLPSDVEAQIVSALAPHCPTLAAPMDADGENVWESHMEEVDLEQFGKRSTRGRQAYEDDGGDDDDDGEGRGGVQCQQM